MALPRPPADTAARPPSRLTSKGRARASTPAAPDTSGPDLKLPHERDQATGEVARATKAVMRQAKRDIDRGLVDTDMRATPGLDAERRDALVSGADDHVLPADVPAPPRRAGT